MAKKKRSKISAWLRKVAPNTETVKAKDYFAPEGNPVPGDKIIITVDGKETARVILS
jgi:hypothetical protein